MTNCSSYFGTSTSRSLNSLRQSLRTLICNSKANVLFQRTSSIPESSINFKSDTTRTSPLAKSRPTSNRPGRGFLKTKDTCGSSSVSTTAFAMKMLRSSATLVKLYLMATRTSFIGERRFSSTFHSRYPIVRQLYSSQSHKTSSSTSI